MKDGEALCPGHADAPATPQPSAPVVDRSACKTFCGQTYWQLGVCDAQGATSAGNEWRETAAYPEPSSDTFSNIRTWCSPACRDARLPPLAAQPAEENPFIATCCGAVGLEAHRPHCKLTKPAEQPKPAAKAECLFFGKSKLHGGEIHFRHWKNMHGIVMGTTVCDYHYLHEIEPKGGGSDVLHNDKVPERLPRPWLAHSMGIEDPTLPEAR
jgi:hypothetical protein